MKIYIIPQQKEYTGSLSLQYLEFKKPTKKKTIQSTNSYKTKRKTATHEWVEINSEVKKQKRLDLWCVSDDCRLGKQLSLGTWKAALFHTFRRTWNLSDDNPLLYYKQPFIIVSIIWWIWRIWRIRGNRSKNGGEQAARRRRGDSWSGAVSFPGDEGGFYEL